MPMPIMTDEFLMLPCPFCGSKPLCSHDSNEKGQYDVGIFCSRTGCPASHNRLEHVSVITDMRHNKEWLVVFLSEALVWNSRNDEQIKQMDKWLRTTKSFADDYWDDCQRLHRENVYYYLETLRLKDDVDRLQRELYPIR